ncbi:copper resistance protein NlpE [Antarcticibacterium arcticum]|uniref:Copper resistance protein NlpE n=1 Tax=Antarcticibacterium arcticum TaxID=2585771 RepID=A0A5B8YP02_9FLAO|nr:copper resistance protein NlpE [Antarcticibacterium arcticum]QED37569.1 copper resistance protein NlpE [Antarcticibacterium arcticum]
MKYLLLSILSLFLFTSCQNPSQNKTTVADLPMEYNPLADGHNSRNSLDWAGTYSGVLSCKDCRAVETYITLNADNSFNLTRIYLETEVDTFEVIKTDGTFTWNEIGSAITLEGLQDEMPNFKVGEQFLIPLDVNGLEVRPEPGNNFKLLKQ